MKSKRKPTHFIVYMAVIFLCTSNGCHLFDDFDSLAQRCPTNSGYPCRCDTSHNKGICDDGAHCIGDLESGTFGVCATTCTGPEDETSCVDTKNFGLQGVCGLDENQDSTPDACVVLCQEDAGKDQCPRGTECRQTDQARSMGGEYGCFAIADSTDSDTTPENGCDCYSGQTACDVENLLVCEDGCHWTTQKCAEYCEEEGFEESLGCEYEDEMKQHICSCTTPISDCACSDGEYSCQNGNLRYCDDGCNWTSYNCQQECIDAGWDMTTGCEYDPEFNHDICLCDYHTGCDCQDGELECVGDNIKICVDNCDWQTYSCEEVCADAGGYWGECSYDTESQHDVCWCNGAKKGIPQE